MKIDLKLRMTRLFFLKCYKPCIFAQASTMLLHSKSCCIASLLLNKTSIKTSCFFGRSKSSKVEDKKPFKQILKLSEWNYSYFWRMKIMSQNQNILFYGTFPLLFAVYRTGIMSLMWFATCFAFNILLVVAARKWLKAPGNVVYSLSVNKHFNQIKIRYLKNFETLEEIVLPLASAKTFDSLHLSSGEKYAELQFKSLNVAFLIPHAGTLIVDEHLFNSFFGPNARSIFKNE